MTISFVIPSIGRPSLQETVASIQLWPGDELLVIEHDPPSNNWGNAERQEGQDRATCDYLAFMDDDDRYVPDHRQIMANAIAEHPGRPICFRIQYPSGRTLPKPSNFRGRPPVIKCGNVATAMFLFPNDKSMLAPWDQTHRWADFCYINRSRWGNRYAYVWRPEIIALIGHNDEYTQFLYRGGGRSPGKLREVEIA